MPALMPEMVAIGAKSWQARWNARLGVNLTSDLPEKTKPSANIPRSSRVSAPADRSPRIRTIANDSRSQREPCNTRLLLGLYSAWERWFGAAVFATQP